MKLSCSFISSASAWLNEFQLLPPYQNNNAEERNEGVFRILKYAVGLPLLMVIGALLMRMSSANLSYANKEVRLYELVQIQEAHPDNEMLPEVEAFYAQGRTMEELLQSNDAVQADFRFYGTIVGALIGLVIGLKLINLSVRRTRKAYEIDHKNCVSCGKCFSYCPQNKGVIIQRNKVQTV